MEQSLYSWAVEGGRHFDEVGPRGAEPDASHGPSRGESCFATRAHRDHTAGLDHSRHPTAASSLDTTGVLPIRMTADPA